MSRLNRGSTRIGLAAVMALLLSLTFTATALADDEKQNFAMLDDFAVETGASGRGVSRTHQGSSV